MCAFLFPDKLAGCHVLYFAVAEHNRYLKCPSSAGDKKTYQQFLSGQGTDITRSLMLPVASNKTGGY